RRAGPHCARTAASGCRVDGGRRPIGARLLPVEAGRASAEADEESVETDEESARARVLEVGAKLFSTHGPRVVTMKWVAMEAAVPLEWLEARWATVDALLASV